VPEDQPRLDRTSLARLGTELQAAHHRSASEPLTQQQRDLLLEWAVAEALQAAQAIGDEENRARALTALAPHLPEAERNLSLVEAAGFHVQHGADGALVVPGADPGAVGAVAAAGGHVLTDLRPADRGLEDLFFQLTA